MKICSYIMTSDTGLAPNPFWGYCTLAVCTPNHMGVKLSIGDWIMGFQSCKAGNKLIYAMRVTEERINFDKYYNEGRFQAKKPDLSGAWEKRCGDNMYFLENNVWKQHEPVSYHNNPVDVAKDTKFPYVYVSEHFFYFGEKAIVIPAEFKKIIRTCCGCKCRHSAELSSGLMQWLKNSFQLGIIGLPKDRHIEHQCDFLRKSKNSKCNTCS
ncbi:MAG: Nmad2 family putative nucleotide modification protein [Desulfobaccales bacterium]